MLFQKFYGRQLTTARPPFLTLRVHLQESYVALEKAIRSLAEFYSKAGPSAPLPQDVKNKILDHLSTADAYL